MEIVASDIIPQDLHMSQQLYVVLSKTDEIVYASGLIKPLLDMDDNGNYHLPQWETFNWAHFLEATKQQSFIIHTENTESKLANVQAVAGYYHKEQGCVILLFHPKNPPFQVASMDKFISAMDFLEIGIVLFSKEGKIIGMNEKVANIIGYSKDCLLDKKINVIKNFFSYQHADMKRLIRQVEKNQEGVLVIQNIAQDLAYYELKVKYNPFQKVYYASLFEHTEYMAMEAQLKEQQFLKELGTMSASIAHEIRNPLTALKGFVDLLRCDADPDKLFYFDVIDREFEHLNGILTDLLHLSRPNTVAKQNIDLVELLKETVNLMQMEANQKQIIIEMEMEMNLGMHKSPILVGNATQLKQIFINLLKNAMQAMQQGTIVIRLVESSEYIQLSIQDDGIGMTGDECKNVFTPFHTTKEGGTGLGLSIVKKVIEDLNGYIEVASYPNIGTSFLMVFSQVDSIGYKH